MSEIRTIALSRGLVATVDAADFDWLSQWKWSALKVGGAKRQERIDRFYACRVQVVDGKQRMFLMHRQIMGATERSEKVDHRNRDTLNNTRSNLRTCTGLLNDANRIGWSGEVTSRFKGVSLDRGKWRVAHRGKYVGFFADEIEAAKAYDRHVLNITAIEDRPYLRLNLMAGG